MEFNPYSSLSPDEIHPGIPEEAHAPDAEAHTNDFQNYLGSRFCPTSLGKVVLNSGFGKEIT